MGTVVLSLAMAVIGVALIVEALVDPHRGGVSALALFGALLVAAGAGRLYAERKRGSRA